MAAAYQTSRLSKFSTSSEQDQEIFRPYWKSKYQHLFFFLGYCVNLRSLSATIYEDTHTNPEGVPSLMQTLLCCIIVAGPVVFIQHFIGQFTQKGCIAIGAMLPAMYGVGFCMLVVSIFDCVSLLHTAGAALIYIATSLLSFPYPAWMYCRDEFFEEFPGCFSREDINLCEPCDVSRVPCFMNTYRTLSSEIFRRALKDHEAGKKITSEAKQIKARVRTAQIGAFLIQIGERNDEKAKRLASALSEALK